MSAHHAQRLLHGDAAAFAVEFGLAVLDHALQAHATVGERSQFGDGAGVDVDHGEVVAAGQAIAHLVPPQVGTAAVVVEHHHLPGAAAGLADAGLVGLADVDPQVDLAAERLEPQVGFVVAGGAAGEFQAFVGMQGECQQAHHQALVRFRRMPGQGQGVGRVVVAIHVADLQLGAEDRCVGCHLSCAAACRGAA